MPDGPYVHRAARVLRAAIGARLAVRPHRPSLAALADALEGRTLAAVDAFGKHLVLEAAGAPRLHLHLGVRGALRADGRDADASTDAVLTVHAGPGAWTVHDPHRCELLDDDGLRALLARLGPDPLREPCLTDAIRDRVRRAPQPIGAALLDQTVVCGVGNDLRAEVLHACGIRPERAAAALSDAELDCVWTTLTQMMVAARDDPRALDPPTASGGEHHRAHEVYRRKRCARCGVRVKRTRILERTAYYCPRCQH